MPKELPGGGNKGIKSLIQLIIVKRVFHSTLVSPSCHRYWGPFYTYFLGEFPITYKYFKEKPSLPKTQGLRQLLKSLNLSLKNLQTDSTSSFPSK